MSFGLPLSFWFLACPNSLALQGAPGSLYIVSTPLVESTSFLLSPDPSIGKVF
jgi:hypothetical protein